MSFLTPDFQSVRDGILRDIVNQRADANVASDGDYAVRANAVGAAVEGLYQHQQWIVRQILPDTADTDNLERHANLRGLSRKAAAVATGTIVFSGTAGAAVPVGTEAKTSAGVAYLTTTAAVVGVGGTVAIAAQAALAGVAGNQAPATSLTLTAAPSGVLSTASIGSMTGGSDAETDDSLLARLLFVLRNPPQGGAAHDYYSWAMSVDGVSAAYIYPLRRGLGKVDIVILATGGLPDAALIAKVQAYIDTVRPVLAGAMVLSPVAVPVAVAATLTLSAGTTAATVRAAIEVSLASYFATLGPGDTVRRQKLSALISDTAGVLDFNLTAPAANVATVVDATHLEMPTLGVVTWS